MLLFNKFCKPPNATENNNVVSIKQRKVYLIPTQALMLIFVEIIKALITSDVFKIKTFSF